MEIIDYLTNLIEIGFGLGETATTGLQEFFFL